MMMRLACSLAIALCLYPSIAPGDDALALIVSDLMAQEAMLAEFGWEETIIEDGAIIIRQGNEPYPPMVANRPSGPEPADYYYVAPPIVVRRAGLRVTINGSGLPITHWPIMDRKRQDPGPPPAYGPLMGGLDGMDAYAIDNYWLEKEAYLKHTYNHKQATQMFWDCLQESSRLSGGEWYLKSPPREHAENGFFVYYSKKHDKEYQLGFLPAYLMPDASMYVEESKRLYKEAVDECSDIYAVMQITPHAWGRLFHLIEDPDADTILSIYMSDELNKSRVRLLPGWEHHPEPIPRIHTCPELEARLAHATQRVAEIRERRERQILQRTGGTPALASE